MFIEQVSAGMILFFVLYGITGVVPAIAAAYLLLRRGNAIAPGVTPPLRLRRWTAAFFAIAVLAHVWWLLFYIYSGDLYSIAYLVLVMFDSVVLFTTFAGMLLAMLQDRRRPVWPALAGMIPFVVLGGVYMVYPSYLIVQIESIYLLLLSLLFTGYMVVAIRQYERWLNDNYADLENKKVWLSQAVTLVCMLLFILYALATDMVLIWIMHVVALVLTILLLWRVETLPTLQNQTYPPHSEEEQDDEPDRLSAYIDLAQIRQQLTKHCEDTQLYLQHDLNLQQLAQAIGTNRYYLSQYFSRQGITYNTYINNLRINHFISRYQEVVAAGQPVVAQQLARESGYSSYSTFSLAFKQRTGMSVTAWMRKTAE